MWKQGNSFDLETDVGAAKVAQTNRTNYVFQEMTFKILTKFSGMPRYQSRRSCQMDIIGFCLLSQRLNRHLIVCSMTTFLTNTVAHSTKTSFRPKTNNQPLKKFVSLAVSWVKVVTNGKILTFKVNFLCQKITESS